MNFNKIFKFITDRPFIMALIVFVVLFIAYNFLFKNKSQTGAATIAATAMPTSGRPTIYNQEFQQFPVTSNPPAQSPIPPGGTSSSPQRLPPVPSGNSYPKTATIRSAVSGENYPGVPLKSGPGSNYPISGQANFNSTIRVTGPAVVGGSNNPSLPTPQSILWYPVVGGLYISAGDIVGPLM